MFTVIFNHSCLIHYLMTRECWQENRYFHMNASLKIRLVKAIWKVSFILTYYYLFPPKMYQLKKRAKSFQIKRYGYLLTSTFSERREGENLVFSSRRIFAIILRLVFFQNSLSILPVPPWIPKCIKSELLLYLEQRNVGWLYIYWEFSIFFK